MIFALKNVYVLMVSGVLKMGIWGTRKMGIPCLKIFGNISKKLPKRNT